MVQVSGLQQKPVYIGWCNLPIPNVVQFFVQYIQALHIKNATLGDENIADATRQIMR